MANRDKMKTPIEYVPKVYYRPLLHATGSAWGALPTIIKDIIVRFNVKEDIAIDFGTATGFSASAFANYFKKVITIDTFKGDDGSLPDTDPVNSFGAVSKKLKSAGFNNIEVVQTRFEDWIKGNDNRYDMIHIDIVHLYEPTFECGEWAVNHCDCVLFHDTMAFPPVMQAVTDLATKYDMEFYNFPLYWGLGILIKK